MNDMLFIEKNSLYKGHAYHCILCIFLSRNVPHSCFKERTIHYQSRLSSENCAHPSHVLLVSISPLFCMAVHVSFCMAVHVSFSYSIASSFSFSFSFLASHPAICFLSAYSALVLSNFCQSFTLFLQNSFKKFSLLVQLQVYYIIHIIKFSFSKGSLSIFVKTLTAPHSMTNLF